MKDRAYAVQRGLSGAGVMLCVLLMAAFFLLSLGLNAHLTMAGPFEEEITFHAGGLLQSVLLTAVALLALVLCRALLERFARVRLTGAMMGLWLVLAMGFVLAIRLVSQTDSWRIIDTARRFAAGDYTPMTWGYTRGCTYQLGMCLLLEGLQRLLPWANIDILMQLLNTVMSVAAAGVLAALGQTLFGSGVRRAALLLYAGFLPFFLFNVFVYGTLPMVLLTAAGFLCFARYTRTGRGGLLAAMAVAMGLAYIAKPNALIALLALLICTLLYAMGTRDARPLLAAVLAVALGVLGMRLVVWQYELRSGMDIEHNVSALTHLVMGLSDSEATPGWYNGYLESFFDMDLTAAQQQAIVMEDLKALLPQLAADPARTAQYMGTKIASQWLEPTYSVLRYGARCQWVGRYNGVAALLFRDGGTLNAIALAYMDVYQQAIYGLAVIGLVSAYRKREDAAVLVIPVTVIGGFLYHALFEAKSQYIYPYVVYLMPYAAQGLCILSRRLMALTGRGGGRSA